MGRPAGRLLDRGRILRDDAQPWQRAGPRDRRPVPGSGVSTPPRQETHSSWDVVVQRRPLTGRCRPDPRGPGGSFRSIKPNLTLVCAKTDRNLRVALRAGWQQSGNARFRRHLARALACPAMHDLEYFPMDLRGGLRRWFSSSTTSVCETSWGTFAQRHGYATVEDCLLGLIGGSGPARKRLVATVCTTSLRRSRRVSAPAPWSRATARLHDDRLIAASHSA